MDTSTKKNQYEELESMDVTTTFNKETDKHKETLSAYSIKGKENILSTSENKEKIYYGYFCMYEYRKQLLHSMYDSSCTAQ